MDVAITLQHIDQSRLVVVVAVDTVVVVETTVVVVAVLVVVETTINGAEQFDCGQLFLLLLSSTDS